MRTIIRTSSRGVAAALVLLSAGCATSTTEASRPCTGAVRAAVDAQNPIRLSWNPSCGFRELRVVATPSETVQWQISADGRLIFPDVRYGEVPTGALAVLPPAPLAVGATYRIEFVPLNGSSPTAVTWKQ